MPIERITGDIAELQDDMSDAKEKLVEHDTRFDNGRHAMGDIRGRIEKLEPKAPDWLKLFGAGMAAIAVLMGAQLWLTDRFNSRPTQAEVEKKIAPIKQAQKETALEIKEIEKAASATKTSVKNIEKAQDDQGKKIDVLLQRIPARRSNR